MTGVLAVGLSLRRHHVLRLAALRVAVRASARWCRCSTTRWSMVGVFSLFQLQFDLTIVAALLTIIGYSINDTVVVFDRVRENLRKYKKMPLRDVLNLSLNETLSRTMMTIFTVLIAVVVAARLRRAGDLRLRAGDDFGLDRRHLLLDLGGDRDRAPPRGQARLGAPRATARPGRSSAAARREARREGTHAHDRGRLRGPAAGGRLWPGRLPRRRARCIAGRWRCVPEGVVALGRAAGSRAVPGTGGGVRRSAGGHGRPHAAATGRDSPPRARRSRRPGPGWTSWRRRRRAAPTTCSSPRGGGWRRR